MTNNTNFIGWSGKTEITKLDLTKITISGSTQSTPNTSSMVNQPITIDKNRTKNSASIPGVKQPVVQNTSKPEPNPDFSKGSKLGVKPNLARRQSINTIEVPFTAGTVNTNFPYGKNTGFNNTVHDIKVQPDGKILVVGDFTYYDYNGDTFYSPYFIRLNADGSPDFDFKYTYDAWDVGFYISDPVYCVEIQSDGKILLGGAFNYYYSSNNYYSRSIMRFNADGSFDDTLVVGDGFNGPVRRIVQQPDNKILVTGDFSSYNNSQFDPSDGPSFWRIIRLNLNGSPDLTFNTGYGFNWNDGYGYVYDIALQPDGKIILGGDFYSFNQQSANYIVRLNSDGSRDNSFVIGDGFNDTVFTLGLQSDGKIIVGGYFNYYANNDLYEGYIVRLDPDGNLDTRFGHGVNNVVFKVKVQSDDKILVGGGMSTFYFDYYRGVQIDEIVRFNADCTFDYSFYYGELLNSYLRTIALTSTSEVFVGGEFYYDNDPFVLNRFGKLNNSITGYKYVYTMFSCTQSSQSSPTHYTIGSNTPLDVNNKTFSFRSLHNPSVVVCGNFKEYYPSNIIDYVYLNEYNDCYDAYSATTKLVSIKDCITGENNYAYVDNKYQVGDILYIDWIVDTVSFDWGNSGYFKFAAVIMEEVPFDDQPPFWQAFPIVPYAPYTSCDEAINANGTHYVTISCTEMETQFPLMYKTYYDSLSILQPTGNNPVKVIVDYIPYGPADLITGGTPVIYSTIEFGTYYDNQNTLCDLGLTSVAPEGVVKSDFYSYFNDGVYTTLEQPDGKILIGGNFREYDGDTVGYIMRLNPDGSRDYTFNNGGKGFDSYVRAISLQKDGKILVGGDFNYYNNEYAGKIIRLNSDGSIDQNFTYSTEFDGKVRAIAIQTDGKIIVGGAFKHYYDYHSERIIRLNSDGTPDTTFVVDYGFDGDVYTINIDSVRYSPFYSTNGPVRYTDYIIVGGWFGKYKGDLTQGIAKLSPTGELLSDFGKGFNLSEGGTPRVNQILKQPDGKLIIIGGGNGPGYLLDYNETWIPQNIVRLEKDNFGIYQIDQTFNTRNFDNSGGFDGAALSISLLPNGKIMVGGQFDYYGDSVDDYSGTGYLVRLNSDGTLDKTFTYVLNDDYINKVLLLSTGKLLVGGWFSDPNNYLSMFYIGEEYSLRSFETCDGESSNIYLPSDFQNEIKNSGSGSVFTATTITYEPVSTSGLDLFYDSDCDDCNFYVELPLDFDVNFLGQTYTSVNVGSNSYLTFGGGSGNNCTVIPSEIPSNVGFPGVYISTYSQTNDCCLDSVVWRLYSGITDGGNTTILRFEGNDDYGANYGDTNLVYNFKFYKDQPNYFDLIIEQNQYFCNNDPTGGVSDGVNTSWVVSFDTSQEKAYRIGSEASLFKPIKGNIGSTPSVCGTVGNIITSPSTSGVAGGSMYFDGSDNTMVQVDNGVGQFGFNGTYDFTIEWFQNWQNGSNSRPFSIGVYNSPTEMIGMSFEGSVYLWINNNNYNTNISNSDIQNGWHHMAITRYYNGGDHVWRVFLDGIQKTSFIDNTDTSNTYTLTIGNQLNNDGLFTGYITNFRVNNLSALYTSDFTVPTEPLTCDPGNIILLMTSTNEGTLLTDSCGSQTISATGVTWSSESPFVSTSTFSLFTSNYETRYNTCDDCIELYKTLLYVRDGVNPDKVELDLMTKTNIDKVLSLGPIFTTGGIECYEILKYYR